ncbi:MAG: hypothetical protein H6713_07280 [Myxococcales bacterium]|nr:hypothetical protein [Myxococcales bacterium]
MAATDHLQLRRPDDAQDETGARAWFSRLAEDLLNKTAVMIGGAAHRLVELEVYYDEPGVHPDPFTHGHALQRQSGRWYLHRVGDGLRGGSFKGVDLTVGSPRASGGVLVRGLERPDGALVDGPSLCVDYMIEQSGLADLAALDRALGQTPAGDPRLPVHLAALPAGAEARAVHRTGRVGLTLKRVAEHPGMVATLLRPYRYLTRPRGTRKGKQYLTLALHAGGASLDEIQRVTGTPVATLRRHVKGFAAGAAAHQDDAALTAFHGQRLTPDVLARLHGAWHHHYG